METKVVQKRFVSDGNAVILDCGFNPTLGIMLLDTAGTNPNIYIWTKEGEETDSRYGLLITGASGEITRVTTAATGLAAHNSKYQGVLVPNPAGGKPQFRIPTTWLAATNYSGLSARTATAAGDVVWPPTKNGKVYELTTATAAGTTEPSSWDVEVGETVTDGGANVFTCRTEETVTKGCQGLTVGATTQTDSQVCEVIAIESASPQTVNAGDVANLGTYDFA